MSMPRKIRYLLLGIAFAAPLYGNLTCAASAQPNYVQIAGTAETVSDISLRCRQTLDGYQFQAGDRFLILLSVSLNVNFTYAHLSPRVADAALIVNENNCPSPAANGSNSLIPAPYGTCGAPDSTIQDPQFGYLTSNNRLEWLIDFPVPTNGTNEVTTLRVTGMKARASQLGFTGPIPTTAFVSITAPTAITTTNNILTIARAVNDPTSYLPSLGTFVDSSWFIDRNNDFLFDASTEMAGWGSPGDIPVVGDWNGDGFRDLGVFSNGTWFLDMNGDAAFDPATDIKGWGAPGWIPITGDWNGDGKTDIGAIDPSAMTWFLDLDGNYAFDPGTEIRGWGTPGDTPVVGDWDGDGDDDIGVFSGGIWFRDVNGDGSFDPGTEITGWGVAGWIPMVGDWNGDGVEEIAAIDPSTMLWFRDLNGDHLFDPGTEIAGWGSPGDVPVKADWNGDGKDDLGVFSNGVWFIDLNGDGIFDPATEIRGWGLAGWTPVPGPWQ